MKFFILPALLVLSFSVSTWGADTSDGCGLGWNITSNTTLSATTTRGTTNATLPPSFSMSSGTSGCAKHQIAKKEDRPAFEYALNNYDSLTIDMARGHGENLTAFARTLGCADGAIEQFSRVAQRHYDDITGAGIQDALRFFKNVKNQIQEDPFLNVACRT